MTSSDIKTKAEEIVLAIRPCINAESYGVTLAAIISLIDEQREALADCVPTNWLDPLLTGPDTVIGKSPYGGRDIENLLRAIKKRVAESGIQSRGISSDEDA